MRRLLILISLLFCSTHSIGQRNDTLLFKAYKSQSLTELQIFFENWAAETSAISKEDFSKLNDTAKNVYLVFQTFYNPTDISRTGGSEWGNDIYKSVKYFLILDKVYCAVIDTLVKNTSNDTVDFEKMELIYPRADKYDTVKHFRPQFSFPSAKCVTLTKSYDSLLNRFLGNKYYKLGTGDIMSPARSKG